MYLFRPLAAVALISLFMLSACEQGATPEPAVPVQPEPAAPTVSSEAVETEEIAWFDGSVEAAFEQARAESKPLFLYWGAVWCPPCVEIKETVLKSPQFIAQSKLFVPVYLDGDTEQAQVWGDRFGTKVYPTMIVFNPAGEEVTRLHAGIAISAYNTVLELSLDSMQPTSELVAVARKDPSQLSNSDLQRLAYYSWYDEERAAPDGLTPELFLALSEEALERNPEASARFLLQFLVMAEAKEQGGANEATRVSEILDSPVLRFACWDYLVGDARAIMAAVGAPEELQNRYARILIENRHDERLSTAKQVSAWGPYLDFHAADEIPVPEDVAKAILADGRAADEKTSGTHSRQSVIDAVADVYMNAGLIDEARALLQAEIESSKLPYYFMSALAYLEEQQGNLADAVEWRRKAYQASSGPATRIRWWSRYVQAQVRMAPQDDAAVQQAALAIFADEAVAGEAFAGANYRNFERASGSLQQWAEDSQARQAILMSYADSLGALCRAQPPQSTEHTHCSALVSGFAP